MARVGQLRRSYKYRFLPQTGKWRGAKEDPFIADDENKESKLVSFALQRLLSRSLDPLIYITSGRNKIMVEYGRAMQKARRRGWENIYLNYDALKDIISQIESLLFGPESLEHAALLLGDDSEAPSTMQVSDTSTKTRLEALKTTFFELLLVEIEKISLFALKKQGQLADAVGGVRFASTGLFDTKALPVHFTRDRLDMLASYGVEMAHLVKYVCTNAIGIQKILKKYNKIFDRLDEPHFYFVESDHLKQLANSDSMASIHASLQTIMDDSYKTENLSDPETSLALLRLQAILACTSIIRKNATVFRFSFIEYLSKKAMIAADTNFGGIDGKGQRALSWLLKLEPQKLRQMDTAELKSTWDKWAAETEIVRVYLDRGLSYAHHRRMTSLAADDLMTSPLPGDEDFGDAEPQKRKWGGADGPSMIINLTSILLYTINYYIVAPTANHYAISLGYDGAFGATLIGASSFSAMFSAFLYSLWYTRSTFKSALIFSALCPLLGNLMYGLAVSYDSMPMAIAGRILCGFGSAEVLNRQLISACVSFDVMTKASALFVAFGASGMSIGPLIAGILDMTAGRDYRVDLPLPFTPVGGLVWNDVTAPGFVMAVLWAVQLIFLIFLFDEPHRINTEMVDAAVADEDHDSEDRKTSQKVHDYGSMASSDEISVSGKPVQCMGPGDFWREIQSTWKLIFSNPGLPITLLIFSYIEMADEVIISSCSMVVRRYFGWHGSAAGFFIASLGALVLPAHFVVEIASRYYSERRILLVSLTLATWI